MTVFGAYSRYYNLLYKDKDYAGEAEYVHNLIRKYKTGATRILDLGCGTGRHDLLLADMGYKVTGVDQSEEMLAVAKSHDASFITQSSSFNSFLPISHPPSIYFQQGDIRSVRLQETFDVVISLFHVMSYQITNDDLQAAFATARAHLKPGGIFIFDCWYGPGVLSDLPVVRIKRLENSEINVVRIAEPSMHYNDNCVDVNYQVYVTEKQSKNVEILHETHKMRYLFKPEIEKLFSVNGFRLENSGEWLTGKELGKDTWSGCFLGVA